MYNIGDEIIITRPGQQYSNYEGMAIKLKATKFKTGYNTIKKNIKGIIKNYYQNYYLIDIGEYEIIMDINGIEFFKKKEVKCYGIVNFCKEYYK